jgi:4'-phosphopantetheinyl transferase
MNTATALDQRAQDERRVGAPPSVACTIALARLDQPLPAQLLDALISTFDAERRAALGRYRQQVDRERGALGDVLARLLVGALAGVRPSGVRVVRERSGRPTVPAHDGLHVSISHSGSWVACAAAHAPVGVDVEAVRPVSPAVLGASGGGRLAVVDAWTAKEAYLKMLGTGLRLDPGTVQLARRGGGLEAAGPRGRARGRIQILRPDRAHRLAVCAPAPPRVRLTRASAHALALDYLDDTTPFTERSTP